MKIRELCESSLSTNLLNKAIQSKFFHLNWKPLIDNSDDIEGVIEDLPCLYHGGSLKENQVNHIKYREASRDTSMVIHNSINTVSQQELGIPIRNMLFSSQLENMADGYGKVSMLIPIDNDYQFYYSTLVDDMYTSNDVFNYYNFVRKSLPVEFDNFLYKGEARSLFEQINSMLDISLLPRISPYILQYIYEVHDSTIHKLVKPNTYTDMSSFEKLKTLTTYENAFKEVYGVLFSVYDTKLSDIDDAEFHKKYNNLVYQFTLTICDFFIDKTKEWVYDGVNKYVDSIVRTTKLSDINKRTEILLPEGEYIVLGAEDSDFNATVLKIVKHYLITK